MNTFVRYFHILSLLRPHPRRLSIAQIMTALESRGADLRGRRTIERDLEKLSEHFPIDCDENRPQGWCWAKDAAIILPGMDLNTALTFRLMKEFMQPLIPTACLSAAERHFSEAGRILNSDRNGYHQSWLEKVQVISRGQPLIPPTVSNDVLDCVYEALFNERQLLATYDRRSGERMTDCKVNPLGLVFVNKSLYLVCTLWDYDDIKQLALHRFTSAKLLETPAREIEGFSLEKYVKDQREFDFPLNSGEIKLEAVFSNEAAHHLNETPLSKDQVIKKKSDSEVVLSATVADTAQLRWWLLGFGDQVEIMKPKKLRDEMVETVRGMLANYKIAK